jgi:hypothetical protein
MNTLYLIQIFCLLSFCLYGFRCALTAHMTAEFARYGIPQFRVLTGILQLVATLGLLVGFCYPWIGALAAGGLSLQMACGLIVRIRIKDSIIECAPAAFYLVLCASLAKQLIDLPV